ncbi:hypothetical protein HXX76_010296 [Chlamydomonas incerta]|uniref:Uncharacterized protein n=1 Tax=Chlamydomonas incerta TaxID=51695 RepID=A0A835VUV4_CHLIN|nr:hypothetical protein HXX76_010296 [Chlamydomonas incerta]|eukprot:KAG2430197.1 hypothetical protein HXX76_010296 [Chlamydomonas incerta]
MVQSWSAARLHGRDLATARRRTVARADPQELMRHLEKELGVRFVAAEGGEDEEEELDDWEDVVAELGNPLDMRPARVGLMDDGDVEFGLEPAAEMAAALAAARGGGGGGGADDDDDDDGRIPLPPLPASAAALAAAAAGAGASGSSSGGGSAYLDPSALTRVGRGELLQLAAPGGSAPGKAAVALLDVREAAELAAASAPRADGDSSSSSTASSGGCGGTGGGGCGGGCSSSSSSAATSLAPWGSRQQHVVVQHVPLSELRRPQAEALAAAADYVAVAATGDHRGEQAVVRLGRVYGLRRVVLYDEAEE